ncbi:MAG: MGMT family protein [Thermoplasmatota archaeon]
MIKVCKYIIGSPLGDLSVSFSEKGLVSISLFGSDNKRSGFSKLYGPDGGERLSAVKRYLSDHFFLRGPGRCDIILDMEGISEFRRSVYHELMKVPFGGVVTYGALADRIGRPGGARAVGQALNKNPFLIVVPCHRVVASCSGGLSLGGFGAGIDAKKLLLRLEGHDSNDVQGL